MYNLLIFSLLFVFLYVTIRKLTNKKKQSKLIRMMILFGSGGHTGEMLMTFKNYNFMEKCSFLYFVHSTSDSQEPSRVKAFIESNNIKLPPYQWIQIPRSRKVKQSYITSIFTTLYSIFKTFIATISLEVDLFVTNGPGTTIPIVYCILLQNWLFLRRKCQILYIESWCRVYDLSLSGKLCYWVTDRFVVQWQELKNKYGKGVCYYGNLI